MVDVATICDPLRPFDKFAEWKDRRCSLADAVLAFVVAGRSLPRELQLQFAAAIYAYRAGAVPDIATCLGIEEPRSVRRARGKEWTDRHVHDLVNSISDDQGWPKNRPGGPQSSTSAYDIVGKLCGLQPETVYQKRSDYMRAQAKFSQANKSLNPASVEAQKSPGAQPSEEGAIAQMVAAMSGVRMTGLGPSNSSKASRKRSRR